MDLKNKVALVTGASRIGQAVALALAERGFHLVLTYRTSKGIAEKTAKKVLSRRRKALLVEADLRYEKDIDEVLTQIKEKFGRLDVLVNMASIYERKAIEDLNLEDWEVNLDVNLKSAYLLSLKASILMRRKGGGKIINFSDWTARSGRPRYRGYVPYYIAKAGVLGLTEVLALELAPKILVNTIAPGPILPPVSSSRKEIEKVVESTPLRRWGGSAEIAKAVIFLAETEFVTGECIRVDGGRHLY